MTTSIAQRLHAACTRPGPRLLATRVVLTLEDAVALDRLLHDHAETACDDCGVPLDEDYGMSQAAVTCTAHDLCTNCSPYRSCRECDAVLREVNRDGA